MPVFKLAPIKGVRKSKPVRFGILDLEAEHWKHFLCFGFYDQVQDKYLYFNDINKGLDQVFDYCFENGIESVFAHNGGKYDFSFCLRYFALSKDYRVSSIIPKGSSILSFDIRKNSARYIRRNGKPFKLAIRDSCFLLPFSLRKIAKSFNVPTMKGYIDYEFLGEAFRNEAYAWKIFEKTSYDEKKKCNLPRYEIYYKRERVHYYSSYMRDEFIHYFDFEEEPEDGERTMHRIYNWQDVYDYLHNDCLALSQCLTKFYEWPLVKKAGPAFTAAGQAVKIWRTFLEKPIFKLQSKPDSFVRKAYVGGRTEIFKGYFDSKISDDKLPKVWSADKGIIEEFKRYRQAEDIRCFDVNSLYPTVMKKFDYPNKFLGFAFEPKFYDPNSMAFWEATVEVPKDMFCPPLGVNTKFTKEIIDANFSHLSQEERKAMEGTSKLIFPTGRFHGIWSVYELEYAKSVGVKVVNLGMGALFSNGGRIFENFIDTMYAMRRKAQEEGDGVSDVLCKLFMNSTYGKLGMNLDKVNLELDDGYSAAKVHSEIKIDDNTLIRFVEKEVRLDSAITNVAIPAMVTAYSRIYMHRLYLECGRENLFYTDTDSIYTTLKLPTGKDLGEVKEETKSKSACFLLPKTYIIDEIVNGKSSKKIAMKGFDKKKIKHFTLDDFRHGLIGELGLLRIKQPPKFATLKTALRKGEFVCMNFDPEEDRERDEIKQRAFDLLCHRKKEAMSRIDYDNWIKSQKKRNFMKKEYKESERGVNSRYDKRVLIRYGIDTIPIHLWERQIVEY